METLENIIQAEAEIKDKKAATIAANAELAQSIMAQAKIEAEKILVKAKETIKKIDAETAATLAEIDTKHKEKLEEIKKAFNQSVKAKKEQQLRTIYHLVTGHDR